MAIYSLHAREANKHEASRGFGIKTAYLRVIQAGMTENSAIHQPAVNTAS
jgi:hypothetical protein